MRTHSVGPGVGSSHPSKILSDETEIHIQTELIMYDILVRTHSVGTGVGSSHPSKILSDETEIHTQTELIMDFLRETQAKFTGCLLGPGMEKFFSTIYIRSM